MSGADNEGYDPLPALLAIGLLAILAICIVGGGIVNNQIVRPLPGVPDAPVVPELPDLAAELRTSKSLCEARAKAALDLLRDHPQRSAALREGRRLYDVTRAEFDGCITYLVAGLDRRFQDGDAARIADRLAEGKRNAATFVAWVDALQPAPVFGAAPEVDLAKILDDWMRRVDEQNQQALEQLKGDLEACRLADWDSLASVDAPR